jgi:PAS domain S-box-containing protein
VLDRIEPRVRLLIAAGTLAMIAMFALGLSAVSSTNDAVEAASAAVTDSRERLVKLQRLLSALQDAETGERGYVITGNDAFLAPYSKATRAIGPLLEGLDQPAATPAFQTLCAELRPRVFDHLEFLAETVELRRSRGAEAAAAAGRSEAGRERMDALRVLIARMQGEVERNLGRRVGDYAVELQRSRSAALGWLSAAFLSSLVMVGLLARYVGLRRRAEDEARAASELLRATVENVAQGILVLDCGMRVLVWNHRFLELRGVDAAALAPGSPFESIVRLGRPLSRRQNGRLERLVQAVDSIAAREAFELEVVRDDGLELEVRGQPMPNGPFVITYSDVTALRRSEASARDQAARLDAILNNVQDGIVTINESGSIESYSAGAERLLGWRADEVLRRNVAMLMPEPHRSRHDLYLAQYLRTGVPRAIGAHRELEGLHKQGALVPIEFSISEMLLGDRRLFVGVLRDIADRRRMQRMQNDFISTVSHELRTPLTSIVGALGLLKGGVGGEIPAQARRLVDMAHDNGLRLVRLVNDFLDLEKMQAGKLEFRLAPHALAPLVRSTIEANRAFGQAYGVELTTDVPADDVMVYVDPERLQQVITNLVSNAVKFSPRGGTVHVAVAREHDRALLSVRDQGPGIPPEFKERVFEKFAQADASDTRGRSGTGLGLSIVKSIVERLDGRVDFDTEVGRGTTFRVRLPLWSRRGGSALPAAPLPVPAAAPATDGAPRPCVLVVEDDPDIVVVLRELLGSGGYAVHAVASGESALDAVTGWRPDAILLDLNLPDRHGRGLVHEFRRRLGAPGVPGVPGVPIMLLSATFGPSETRDAARLGADDCLEKPVDGPRLLAALDARLGREGARRSPT